MDMEDRSKIRGAMDLVRDWGYMIVLGFTQSVMIGPAKVGLLKTPVMYEYPKTYSLFMRLYYGSFYRRRTEIFLNEIDVQPTDSVLEMGCGDGTLFRDLCLNKYVGVDDSEAMFQHNDAKNFKILKADANNFSLGETFDKIVMRDLLHHLGKDSTVFDMIRRHSHKGTAVFIWDCHAIARLEKFAKFVNKAFDGYHGDWYVKDEMRAMFERQSGMKLLKYETFPRQNIMAVLEVE